MLVPLAGTLMAIAAVLLSWSGSSSARSDRATTSSRLEFLSLVPACACGRSTVLAAFSLQTGERLGTVTSVKTRERAYLSLSGGPSGEVLQTATRPALCTGDTLGCGPKPDTCRGQVSELVGSHFKPIFTAADSVRLSAAVASPDGQRLAMAADPCTKGPVTLSVRDLSTGAHWILRRAARCSDIGSPAWSANGQELVFPYSRVRDPGHLPQPGVCPGVPYARLAIAPAARGSRSSSWTMIKADHGCSFDVATFDPAGIAAVEGCRRKHASGSFVDPNFGQAVLLQLNRHQQVTTRVDLKPGWEQGTISTEPSGDVLVTQDQPANEPYPERDLVWEFDGRHLRLIRAYKALDAAHILAVPR
jgi:hypothetical protein